MKRFAPVVLVALASVFALAGCSSVEPKNADDFKMRGDEFYADGKWDQAYSQYKMCVALDEDIIEGWIALGYTCLRKGQEAYIKNPNLYGWRERIRRFDEARNWALECQKRDKNNPEAYYLIGLLNFHLGENMMGDSPKEVEDREQLFHGAIENFDKCLDYDPRHMSAHFQRSWSLFYLRKWKEAAEGMSDHLENHLKVKGYDDPRVNDLKHWVTVLTELHKNDGKFTNDGREFANRIVRDMKTGPALPGDEPRKDGPAAMNNGSK